MKDHTVPQSAAGAQIQPVQQEFNFDAIKLEPVLQIQAATLPPTKRRALAAVYERWARQLRVSAKVLENQRPSRRHPLTPLPRRRLAWN